jgi:nitrogen fixation-related uncharacterized protein
MNRKPWILGGLIGVSVGLVIALTMSYVDWRHNPQGIFHDELGTNWDFVLETAVSWFVPVALIAFILSIAVFLWFSRK